ncbi:polysaccharide export protein [Pigmentiphaga soli]|uniref:Polysaccharide export protein n=1 Tax=Pigmentiphaga soli TaxID=1007095 RepID=A0ABP8H2W5_9BURK
MVPGTYLGVTAPTISETDTDYVYDTTGTDDVTERADIFSITPASIAKLISARTALNGGNAQIGSRQHNIQEPKYSYKVGAQDVLLVTVWNHPELNNPAGMTNLLAGRTVGEDGTFFYPYAGNVQAAGKSVQQIRSDLTARLNKVLVEPQVDVSVLTYRSKRVFAMGQVQKPGVVPITDVPLNVTDLITQSGGVTPEADLKAATLTRGTETIHIDLYALYYHGDINQNVRLQSGDILTIPENRYNKIFVLGEVTKPQSLIMPRGRISLAEALSDAGGFNPLTSNAGQMYVIRRGPDNRPQIWHLDAASPDALVLADQFDLAPRDIVYVDPAAVARFGRVISNILPTARFIYTVEQ